MMGIFSKLSATIAPVTALKRARARVQLDAILAYEAALPSRTRATKRETRSADNAVFAAGVSLREQARWLDENHDLAIGVLDKLEERIVGPHGIQIEPQPLTLAGDVHEDFAALLASRFTKWAENPDVTGMFTLPEAERILLRSALRDGEVFIQLLRGAIPDLKYETPEKFALELLEADFVPMWPNGSDGASRIIQGVVVNRWGRPTGYCVYKNHPGAGFSTDTRQIPAESILHLAVRKRLHQVRGVSLFHGVMSRLGDLKSYEDAERVAARVSSMLGFYIKRGDSSVYADDSEWVSPSDSYRDFEMAPGMVYDRLAPGEELQMLSSDRPNPNLMGFRNGQLRALAAGVRTGYSSIARDYNGTYSAQRQELIEAGDGYAVMQNWFVARVVRPVYREWLKMFLLSGVEVPGDVSQESLFDAVYMGPVLPWIDPQKESEAWKAQIRGGAATEAEWIRARGRSPLAVKRQRQREVKFNKSAGLVFDTDPANDKGSQSNGRENDASSTG